MTSRCFIAAIALPLALSACNPGANVPHEDAPLAGASIGGPFELVDKTGTTVRWQQFDGTYRIIYFGYAFCPDACPTDVGVAMRGFAKFEKDNPELASQVQPMFVSIDPQRDTPRVVGEFAAAFHPRLIGLTGTPQQVAAAAKGFKVYFARGSETSGGYLMDHSRIAYLMGRKGEPIAMLPVEKGPDAVAAELVRWVR